MRNKEYFLIMQEEDFNNLTEEQRSVYTTIEVKEVNEYKENREDKTYLKYYKEQKKAKDALKKYLFNKRNK